LKVGYYQYEIADANGCEIIGSATVTSPNQHCGVIMPTAFSPNGDGNNDIFRPKVYDALQHYQLSIYNRWGGLVFQTNDPSIGWDGNYKGMPQDPQAFIYVCTFNNRNNERKEFRGSLVLIR
jgi:gliding motility-associated-like protein